MIFDPVKFRRRAARCLMWIVLLGIAAAPRVAMLQTVERRLDADESIVGLMAKHIAGGEGVPFFFYGQNYGGGHVLEALLAAPLLALSGMPAEWAVHLPPLIFSVAIIALVFIYAGQLYGKRAGFFTAALLGFSTVFLKSSLKADGYIETIFLCVAALLFYQCMEHALHERAGTRAAAFSALTGAALGLAWWCYDFALVYAAAVALIGLRRWLPKPWTGAAFVSGFIAGTTPLIVFNLTHDFAHIKHMIEGGPGGFTAAAAIYGRATELFTRELPAFMSADCTHNFVFPVSWYSYIWAATLGISILILMVFRRRVPGVVALAPIFAIAAYLISGYAGRSPRYLLPLEPFISMIIATAIVLLYEKRRYITRLLAVALLAAVVTSVVAGAAAIFSDDSIVEGNVKTHPESLVQVVRELDDKKVKCVITTYFIKWRILFLSDERINAIDVFAHERDNAYLRYEDKGCPGNEPPAYVLHKNSRYRYSLAAEINRRPGRYEVYYSRDHIAVIPVFENEPESESR